MHTEAAQPTEKAYWSLYKQNTKHRRESDYILSVIKGMWDMSDLFTQGNRTPQSCEFLCCHGYASIVTCYLHDFTRSSGRNRLKA